MLDAVQQLFDKYSNPSFGSLYASKIVIEELGTKKKTNPFAISSASDFASSVKDQVEMVFSAVAIAEFAKMGMDMFNLGSYGSGFYTSNGLFSASATDYTSIFQAVA